MKRQGYIHFLDNHWIGLRGYSQDGPQWGLCRKGQQGMHQQFAAHLGQMSRHCLAPKEAGMRTIILCTIRFFFF